MREVRMETTIHDDGVLCGLPRGHARWRARRKAQRMCPDVTQARRMSAFCCHGRRGGSLCPWCHGVNATRAPR